MPATTDIVAAWRRPATVMRRHLEQPPSEARALIFLMSACLLVFISQWPVLTRQATLADEDLYPLLGASLFAWIFLAPLLLYGIAFLTHLVMAVSNGGKGWPYATRLALFWSFLASTPLILLNGLVGGFLGDGPALQLVGAAWLAGFLWIWIMSLKAVRDALRLSAA